MGHGVQVQDLPGIGKRYDPVIESLEPGEDWRYCFLDRTLVRPPLGREPRPAPDPR